MYKDTAQHVSLILNKHFDYSTPILFVPFKPSKPTTINAAPAKNVQTIQQKKIAETPIVQSATVTSQPVQKSTTSVQSTPPKENTQTKEVKEPPKKEIKKKTNEPQKIAPAAPAATLSKQTSHNQPIPENTQISDNFRHVEALRKGAQLQKELVTQWKPPFNASKDCCCEIEFTVDKIGKIQKYAMIKSSGNLLYDISAKQALFSCTMPRWTYEKSLTISFTQ